METPKSNNKIIRRRQREIKTQRRKVHLEKEAEAGLTLPAANEHLKPPDPEGASPALSPTPSGVRLALPMP